MSDTEFERSIKLLNELSTNEDALARFKSDPEAILEEFGIRGEEAERFTQPDGFGLLKILGWRITKRWRILSPWPAEYGERRLFSVTPGKIAAGQRRELEIVGRNFCEGDRVGFKRQGKDDDVESFGVRFVSDRKLTALVEIPKTGTYDVAVGRTDGSAHLKSGLVVE